MIIGKNLRFKSFSENKKIEIPNEVIADVFRKNSLNPILDYMDKKIPSENCGVVDFNISISKPIIGESMIASIGEVEREKDYKLSFYKDIKNQNEWIIIRDDQKIVGSISYDQENQLIIGILDDDVSDCQIIQKCYKGDLVGLMMKKMMKELQDRYTEKRMFK